MSNAFRPITDDELDALLDASTEEDDDAAIEQVADLLGYLE